jgi:acylphosphatase
MQIRKSLFPNDLSPRGSDNRNVPKTSTPKTGEKIARRFVVRGRVQGVGYRYFVQKWANSLGIRGYARNLDDGNVEVYAIGTPEQLSNLRGYLLKGPRMSDVRGIDEKEAPIEKWSAFEIEH